MFAGIAELTQDGRGYVFWKGSQVDHYSFTSVDRADEKLAARGLADRCRKLEALGVPVSTATAVWFWSWYEEMSPDHQFKAFMGRPRDLYEKEGTGLGYYVETKSDEISGSGTFHYWTGTKWEHAEIAWELPNVAYHTLAAQGWHTAKAGQGKDLGICYATTGGVTELLLDWKFPVKDYPGLKD